MRPPPQTFAVPPPPQVWGDVQLPQLTLRAEPQLSLADTVSQVFPSRAQKSASLSGVHAHAPFEQLLPVPQLPQAAPPLPHAEAVWAPSATHVVPLQQPVQLAALQLDVIGTHAPWLQVCPLGQLVVAVEYAQAPVVATQLPGDSAVVRPPDAEHDGAGGWLQVTPAHLSPLH
jgi:hypothetical protein